MRRALSSLGVLALLLASVAPGSAAAARCKLAKIAEFPVTMTRLRPLVTATINDTEVQLTLDSGSFYSMISAAGAAQLKLRTFPAPFGFYVSGVNGKADVSLATAKTFTLAGAPMHDVEFLVGGSEVGEGSIGVLGQNFLHSGDVEYDLGQGVVRLMKAVDCSKALLAYWVSQSTQYSVVDLRVETGIASRLSHTLADAHVNGVAIRVLFDTGAPTSMLSLRAAARAGVKPDSAGVVDAGPSFGFGKGTFATYIAPFASFKIGDEDIKNTRLRIGAIDLSKADMLLGADFFLSHRIYVANSQHKVYFTYNGGPVFNLTSVNRPPLEPEANASAPQASSAAGATEEAADYSRRGAALASRGEFDQALAALNRACELAPGNPDYLYQRGMVYWQTGRPLPALADLDQALKSRPNDLRARLARAELLLQRGEKDRAAADLDAADAIAPKEASERYEMAHAYERIDRLATAIAQLTLWIDSHAADARLPNALNSRCWIRALEGQELALALKDCDAALKSARKSSPFYAEVTDSRGLVLLRLGDYLRSMADYDASLKIQPQNPWALYGRGIDELRQQRTVEGNADIAYATIAWPEVAEEFKRRGITP